QCEVHVDTFHVMLYPIKKYYSTSVFNGKCAADSFNMKADKQNQSNYVWEDGVTTGPTRRVNTSGTYWVSYQNDSLCEYYRDSFIVKFPEEEPVLAFSADTLVCAGDNIFFQNTSDTPYNSFIWSFDNADVS